MKKLKYLLIITLLISSIGITSAFALNKNRSNNEIAEEITTDNFIYTNSDLLNIPKINFEWNIDIKGKTEFEYAGFIYKRENGFSPRFTSIKSVANPETVETIGLFSMIGNTSFYEHNLYESIDLTKYTNAKNLIYDYYQPFPAFFLQDLPAVENLYLLSENRPAFALSSLKYIILCNGIYNNSTPFNKYYFTNSFSDIKYVTIDAYKYVYKTYFERAKNSFPNPHDAGAFYVIPDDELQIPLNRLAVPHNLDGYKEFGGGIYVPIAANNSLGFKYALTYVDPLVTKIVIDENFCNEIAEIIRVDTVYLKGTTIINYYNLYAKTLITAIPLKTDYAFFDRFLKVYLYKSSLNNTFKISSEDIENYYITTEFFIPSMTGYSVPSGFLVTSYSTKILPEIEITFEDIFIATTDLSVKVAELKLEVGITDIDIYGHPLTQDLPEPTEPTVPEPVEPNPDDEPDEEIPPITEENPDEEEPTDLDPDDTDPGENETPPLPNESDDNIDNSNKNQSNNPKNIMLGAISVITSLLLFYFIYLVIRRKKDK